MVWRELSRVQQQFWGAGALRRKWQILLWDRGAEETSQEEKKMPLQVEPCGWRSSSLWAEDGPVARVEGDAEASFLLHTLKCLYLS